MIRAQVVAIVLAAGCLGPAAAETVVVHAAGSLRAALVEVARAFEQHSGHRVSLTFGASGLLKDRLKGGEASQVFASANMAHPQALHAAGKAEAAQVFARNALCLLAAPGFSLKGRPLAQRLADDDVRLGTSTPKADPSGDYAFEMFDRIESSGAGIAGSAAVLKRKALQLTGGPSSPPPPPGRNVYGMIVATGQVDAFVTYCTNASQAVREEPALQVLNMPPSIDVVSDYGITLVRPVQPAAREFIDFVLGPSGQQALRSHGFSSPGGR